MKYPKRSFTVNCFAICIVFVTHIMIFAGDVVDQEQLMTASTGSTAVGGSSEQEIAQSFTVGVSGYLTQIRLPIGCADGELVVEIQRLDENGDPSGVVVASARVPHGDLPPPLSDFKTIFLSPPLLVRSGDKFAIVLTNPTGSCGVLTGPQGDTYPGGKFFYDSRPNPPGWVGGKDRPSPLFTPGDMPFQTVVDNGSGSGSSNMCYGVVNGSPIPLPISKDVPVCNCLSDGGLNSWRCRLLHPDFFIIRWIELRPDANGGIIERWSFTPLTKLSGLLKFSFKGEGLNRPIVHEFGKRSKVGTFEHFKLIRNGFKIGRRFEGQVTFSYPMENATVPFQKEFGFDASIPAGSGLKDKTNMRSGKTGN